MEQDNQVLHYLKLLDVFPKTVDDAKEPSVSGGGVSIFVFLVLAILFVSEVEAIHAQTNEIG
jgi:hypothetical protein